MNRLVGVYSVLLVAALVGAFLSWTREPEEKENPAVVLFDTTLADLARVEFKSDRMDVVIETKRDNRGDYLWVRTEKTSTTVTNKKTPAAANGKSASVPADAETTQETPESAPTKDGVHSEQEPSPEEPKQQADTDHEGEVAVAVTQEFKAGEAGQRVVEHFAPFQAMRRLEGVGVEKLDEFGLKTPHATLKLVAQSGSEASFEVGTDGYGHRHIYLRDPRTGTVYLIDGGAIRPLRHADTRLPDRELVDVKEKDATEVVLRTNRKTVVFEQRNRADRSAAYWSSVGADVPNDSAKSWLGKIFRLRATKTVQQAEKPNALETAFSLEIKAENLPVLKLELLSEKGNDGELAWFARSEHIRGLVEINASSAASVRADAESILNQEPDGSTTN